MESESRQVLPLDFILTRDVRFAKDAEKALKIYPDMALVLVRLSQRRSQEYVHEFLAKWKLKSIINLPLN